MLFRSVGGFLLPFFFLFNPGIMLLGVWYEMIWHTLIGFVLVFAAALVLHGHVLRYRLNLWQQGLLIGACCLMLWPNPIAQAAGAALAVALFVWLRQKAPLKSVI